MGRPGRRSDGTRSPKSATDSAQSERQRDPGQLTEPPDPVDRGAVERDPEHQPEQRTRRRGRASRRSHSSGTSADERQRPQADGRERRGQGEARGQCDQERERDAGGAPSGAVAAQHLLLVRQLTAVLHQEASLADELGLLHRDDPGVGRIGGELLFLGEGEDDLFLFLGCFLGGFLLGRAVSWMDSTSPAGAPGSGGTVASASSASLGSSSSSRRRLRASSASASRPRMGSSISLMVSFISVLVGSPRPLDARGLYCRWLPLQPKRQQERS